MEIRVEAKKFRVQRASAKQRFYKEKRRKNLTSRFFNKLEERLLEEEMELLEKKQSLEKNAQELKVRQNGGRDREACCDR